MTAGLAIVGASVIAVAPLSTAGPVAQGNQGVTANVELSAVSDPLTAALILAEGLAETSQNAGGAAALAPLSPGLAAIGLALGDNELTYSVIRQSIDAPLWAADPTINALAAVLPAPIGGGEADNNGNLPEDGVLVQFRDNVLWAATNAARTAVGNALDVDPAIDENPAAIVGAGLLASGERLAEGAALAPLGLIPIAQAIASGDKADLYVAIRQYIDAPLWAADPAINGLAATLPKPLGGGQADNQGDQPTDGAVVQFRDDVLWKATNQTRTAVANVLGVDPSLPHATTLTSSKLTVVNNGNVGKFTPGSTKAVGADKTDRPRPVATAVKAINNQLRESAEHLSQTAKKLSGADDSKKEAGAADNG
jgi:hypothetical protein